MVTVDNLFFELIQIALGNKDRLSHNPSKEEWENLFLDAQKQSVVGVAFEGVQKLPKEQWPPQALLFKWIGTTEIIKQRNALLDKQCVKLQKRFHDVGVRSSILKGQGIARLYEAYPQPLPKGKGSEVPKGNGLGILRQPGDIDIYVDCGRVRLFEIVDSIEFRGERQSEDKNRKSLIRDWDYKHLHLDVFKDTEVEVHYRVEVLLSLWKNRKLQRWFKEHETELFAHANDNLNANLNLKANTNLTNDTNRFVTPTVEFNVFYILLHIYRHFLYEGVGMRQIMDYYFVLRMVQEFKGLRVQEYVEAVCEFGMEKFAKGLMWVMQEVLGMPRGWMLWEPDEKEGRYILEQVMTGGNFGHHDERLKHSGGKLGAVKAILTHNMHLLTHYPSDVIWAPVWIVWHKLWKLTRRGVSGDRFLTRRVYQ